MNVQWAGPIYGLLTVLTIGLGHALVRWLHARWCTRFGLPLMILGGTLLFESTQIGSNLWAGALGIVALTTIWDGVEIFRQAQRASRDGKAERETTASS